MNPLLQLKAATRQLPAVLPSSVNALTARLTGLNRFGFSGFTSLEQLPPDNTRLLQQGYIENHYVFTIADWKALQYAMATPIVYEVKEQKHFRKYRSLTAYQKKDSYSLRYKAIAEVENLNDPLVKVLKNPNPYQSWAEYAYAESVMWDFGNALVWGVRLPTGINKGQIRELYHLSPVLYAGKNPGPFGYGFYTDSTGLNQDISGLDVLHLRRFNADPYAVGGQLWGMSKLTPFRRLLTKSFNSIDAESEMMQNRGGRTIVFPKGVQYSDEVSTAALDGTDLIRKKLKQAGAGGIAGVGVELGSIELSFSPVDLEILKSNTITKEEFCAGWHVNALSVFSSSSGATFANLTEANKGSLRTGVLPDLALRDEKYNGWLVPAYGDNRYIESNTDVFPELQADKKEQSEWMAGIPLTGDEIREAFGYPAIGTPEMQIPLVRNTLQPVTDMLAPANEDPNAQPKPNDGTY